MYTGYASRGHMPVQREMNRVESNSNTRALLYGKMGKDTAKEREKKVSEMLIKSILVCIPVSLIAILRLKYSTGASAGTLYCYLLNIASCVNNTDGTRRIAR